MSSRLCRGHRYWIHHIITLIASAPVSSSPSRNDIKATKTITAMYRFFPGEFARAYTVTFL